jgi:predicted PurR-regulated permease PerM
MTIPSSTNSPTETSDPQQLFLNRSVEAFIRISLLALILAWSFIILRPFFIPIIWGAIIAVAIWPGYQRMLAALGERHKLAAVVFTVIALLTLIVPTALLSGTVVSNIHDVAADLSDGRLTIPPPWAGVSGIPVIGKPIEEFWSLAAQNLRAALESIEPELKQAGLWLLSTAAGAGFSLIQFLISILIAGVLLAHGLRSADTAHSIGRRLSGEHGDEFIELAGQTVRGVARGILGVALIQSLIAGLGFLIAGVPAAGIWALLCLILGVAQIGILPVIIPVVLYLFSTADTTTAVLFLIFAVPVSLIDNILKPILLGRGSSVPMPIIFLGAIGGFLSSGIIGLFIGAVVLALGHELFMAWLRNAPSADSEHQPGTAAPPP